MPIVTDDNTVSVEEFAETLRRIQPALTVPEDGTARDLLKVWKRQMDRLDVEMGKLYEERFVQTASGEHLERLGTPHDIERKTNESDDKLRRRIEAAQVASRSRGTYRDIAIVAQRVFCCDPSGIELRRPHETDEMGLIIVAAPSHVIDDSPLTVDEMLAILSRSVVGGHRLQIQTSDAFTFGEANLGFGTEWGRIIGE